MKKYLYFMTFLISTGLFFTGCKKENFKLFVGSYTDKEGDKGFSVFDFNAGNGDLKLVSEADAGPNPSYFCYSKKSDLFYVINEVPDFEAKKGGGLTTLRYDVKGIPEKKNEFLIPYGGPCFVSISNDNRYLFVANYPNGSVAVIRLNREGIPESVTDTILFDRTKPDASHAHMIINDPAGRLVYLTDLGLDRILSFRFDPESGILNRKENSVTNVLPGSGPRHFTFNRDGSRLYLINELGSTIMGFNIGSNGDPELIRTISTLGADYKGSNACADIHLGKNGKFLYGSNRGENSIVTFSVSSTGQLTLVGSTSCGGNWPRNFTIDPTGTFLLVGNERSDNISVFRIDQKTGLPSHLNGDIKIKKPVCLKFID